MLKNNVDTTIGYTNIYKPKYIENSISFEIRILLAVFYLFMIFIYDMYFSMNFTDNFILRAKLITTAETEFYLH